MTFRFQLIPRFDIPNDNPDNPDRWREVHILGLSAQHPTSVEGRCGPTVPQCLLDIRAIRLVDEDKNFTFKER